MTGWDGEHFPPSRPRKAAGGIKARSKRGPIGEQWWSRRFIEVLESLGLASRLSRGRNYARSGQVLALDIGTGHVTATVQGSRPKPYKVRLTVVPLTTPQWVAVEVALASRAVFRARLLAGEMPAEIEEVFAGCGTPLFPRGWRDLEMSCSCSEPHRKSNMSAHFSILPRTRPRRQTCWMKSALNRLKFRREAVWWAMHWPSSRSHGIPVFR